ncbi:hypothetical protein FB451DRAFT_368888 [Mycena latifolia]|nr:hypothetical protein FB451DRAFT_368888 [Mycena latifolia]
MCSSACTRHAPRLRARRVLNADPGPGGELHRAAVAGASGDPLPAPHTSARSSHAPSCVGDVLYMRLESSSKWGYCSSATEACTIVCAAMLFLRLPPFWSLPVSSWVSRSPPPWPEYLRGFGWCQGRSRVSFAYVRSINGAEIHARLRPTPRPQPPLPHSSTQTLSAFTGFDGDADVTLQLFRYGILHSSRRLDNVVSLSPPRGLPPSL